MADTTEQHEVSVPETKQGTVQFLTPGGIANPAPRRLVLICNVTRNVFMGTTPIMVASQLFTSHQLAISGLILSLGALVCEGIKQGAGVVPTT